MMWVAGVAVAGAAIGLAWYGCAAPSSQWLGPSLGRGPADGKRIALTFDDGPAPPRGRRSHARQPHLFASLPVLPTPRHGRGHRSSGGGGPENPRGVADA